MAKLSDKGKDVSNFLKSNSLVAKTSFIIILVIVFLILFDLGIHLIAYLVGPNKDPYVVDGMIDGTSAYEIVQDPNSKKSITIYRSDNERNGIEFTWSVWIYIDKSEAFDGAAKYKHVFSKGDPVITDDDETPAGTNAPGLYIAKEGSYINAIVLMDTYNIAGSPTHEQINIERITKNKWLNILIRCKNIVIDVYVNGTVTKQAVFNQVPKQNYDNIFIAQNNGFQGKISNLRYFDHAINLSKIQSIVNSGPNLKSAESQSAPDGININPPYLSFKWYLSKNDIS